MLSGHRSPEGDTIHHTPSPSLIGLICLITSCACVSDSAVGRGCLRCLGRKGEGNALTVWIIISPQPTPPPQALYNLTLTQSPTLFPKIVFTLPHRLLSTDRRSVQIGLNGAVFILFVITSNCRYRLLFKN